YFYHMVRSILIFFILIFINVFVNSQSIITGTVIDDATGEPLFGVTVRTSLPDQTTTDNEGHFTIKHSEVDDIVIIFEWNGETTEYKSKAAAIASTDLGKILIHSNLVVQDAELPTITLDDGEDNERANISGLLQSGDDLFGSITNYTFSPAGYMRRGLKTEYSGGYLHNIPIND